MNFHEAARAHVAAALEPGEALQGFCAATQTKTFSGRLVALAATDRRLFLVPLNRRIEPDGDVVSLPPDRIAAAKADGEVGLTVKLRTTDGSKLKLMMMHGGASAITGGPEQQDGVAAVAAFFRDL